MAEPPFRVLSQLRHLPHNHLCEAVACARANRAWHGGKRDAYTWELGLMQLQGRVL